MVRDGWRVKYRGDLMGKGEWRQGVICSEAMGR